MEAVKSQFTSTSDIGDHLVLLHFRFQDLGGGRNRGPWRDRHLESVSLEEAERGCGCNVHSIWPMSFGRKSRARDIQCRSEIVVVEVLPENFNILVRGVCHGVGKKVLREFKGFFWSSKPEDALCDGQKFVGVNHRSLAYEAKH